VHLRCSGVGEADLDVVVDQRSQQVLCTIHVL
jgi:hypothetical protein